MCIIVDANVSHRMVTAGTDPACQIIHNWIEKQGGRLVIGGKLTEELFFNEKVRRWIRGLQQAGRVHTVSAASIEKHDADLTRTKACISNDRHILALARASGARVLFSLDEMLHQDFKNARLINEPRGSIYQNAGHRQLVERSNCKDGSC